MAASVCSMHGSIMQAQQQPQVLACCPCCLGCVAGDVGGMGSMMGQGHGMGDMHGEGHHEGAMEQAKNATQVRWGPHVSPNNLTLHCGDKVGARGRCRAGTWQAFPAHMLFCCCCVSQSEWLESFDRQHTPHTMQQSLLHARLEALHSRHASSLYLCWRPAGFNFPCRSSLCGIPPVRLTAWLKSHQIHALPPP